MTNNKLDFEAARECSEGFIKEKNNPHYKSLANLGACYLALSEQVAELKEALRFYADTKNYTQISSVYGPSVVKISIDDIEEGWSESIGFTTKKGGKRARQVLEKYKKESV